MIEMEDIKKSFKLGNSEVWILKGISLYIGQGEFVSIMGPSGSGKSTLSSILGCLSRPTAGHYKIDGKDAIKSTGNDLARLRNKKIGFIFQDFNLLEGISAIDNVALPLFYGGVAQGPRRRKAIDCLKKVGLENRLYHTPKQLSGGQKQRVAIARSLVNDPTFLFGDEPTGALDKKTGHEIMGLMQRLNLQGHTVVQVTHSALDANFSKRILHLVDGLIVKDEMVEKPTIGVLDAVIDSKDEVMARFWRVAQSTSVLTPENLALLKQVLASSKTSESVVEGVRAISRWDQVEDMMEQLFRHEHWAVRSEVIKIVSVRPKDKSVHYSLRALEDENAWVRYLAANHLKKNWPISLTDDDKKRILAHLEDDDERVRASIVAFVSQWKDPTLIPWFQKAMQDKDGRVRANALDAVTPLFLSKSAPPDVIESVRVHLEDKNNRARANAAILLYSYEPKLSLSELCKMVTSDNNLMRASSAWALGQTGSDEAGLFLLERLRTEREELVLGQVIRSLGKLSKDIVPLSRQLSILFEETKTEAVAEAA
ncbi:MAG: ATP-binding cassette domain-containing protein [Deltaproteobacteria bacterium]|nr:ATP-binding cassette domain-containing protein [Deltaproteobacteria bacterium]